MQRGRAGEGQDEGRYIPRDVPPRIIETRNLVVTIMHLPVRRRDSRCRRRRKLQAYLISSAIFLVNPASLALNLWSLSSLLAILYYWVFFYARDLMKKFKYLFLSIDIYINDVLKCIFFSASIASTRYWLTLWNVTGRATRESLDSADQIFQRTGSMMDDTLRLVFTICAIKSRSGIARIVCAEPVASDQRSRSRSPLDRIFAASSNRRYTLRSINYSEAARVLFVCFRVQLRMTTVPWTEINRNLRV